MASEKHNLPQGGTDCTAVGESPTETSVSVCPANLGGASVAISLSTTSEAKTNENISRDIETMNSSAMGYLPDQPVGESEGRKRPFSRRQCNSGSGSASSTKAMGPPKVPKSRRGRGVKNCKSDQRKSGRLNIPCSINTEETDTEHSSISLDSSTGNLPASMDGGCIDTEDELFDPSVVPSNSRAKKNLPSGNELAKEMKNRATSDLGTCIKNNLMAVEKVADRSRNLKGSFVHSLRVAVRTVEAAVQEIMNRAPVNENIARLEKENDALRTELSSMGEKVDKLTEEISRLKNLQANVATVSTPGPSIRQTALPCQRRSTEISASSLTSTVTVGRVAAPTLSRRTGEAGLMEQIGSLIDQKLAAFKADIFPDKVIRPALRKNNSIPQTLSPSVVIDEEQVPLQKKKRKSKKGTKQFIHPPIIDLPAVAGPPSLHVPVHDETWATVAGRKSFSGRKQAPRGGKEKKGRVTKLPRSPSTAAISVTIPEGSTLTYSEVMAAAKSRIRLRDLGIDEVKAKRAVTGGIVLTISGPDNEAKADVLATRMRSELSDLSVRIARPNKLAEIRIKDLDDAITPEEVASAVAEEGGCLIDNVKVGEIRRSAMSLGTVWARCPVSVAKKLVESAYIRIGWNSARVELLDKRPLQCYRCLAKGHVGRLCPNGVDRSDRCFMCAETGHKAKACTARVPKCPLCSDLGYRADHRLGTKKCSPPKEKRRNIRESLSQVSTRSKANSELQASVPDVRSTEAMEASQ